MSIARGTRLGPYEIVESIGAGGMGEVWRAKDTRLDRDVAIKVLPAGFAENEQFLQRFEREARTISSLNHPHICTLFDVGEAASDEQRVASEEGDSTLAAHRSPLHYLVMELIEGESLADRLKKGPLPLHDVLKYGRQIASALDAAHKRGVTHRDLKPGNIMLTKSGAKLLDFGLAKSAAEGGGPVEGLTNMPTEAKPLTQEGTILGTFQYMAPEQLEGTEADARTDIFALGAVLYEMATGRRAFQGETKTSLIAAIVSQQPEPISQVTPMTPPALDHVVRRCLEKDPDDRWQSAQDIASELQWISEAGSQAGVATPITMRRKSRERLAWSLLAVAVAISGWLGWEHWQSASTPKTRIEFAMSPPFGTKLFPFHEAGVALSPDGSQIVFAATGLDGKQRLWLRDLDSVAARELPETSDASYPFWSPDGAFIGFFAEEKLKKISVAGGPPQVICGDTPSGRGAAWAEDGTILFAPNVYSGIHRVSASGGTPEEITRLDPETDVTHRWPIPLPDGKHFLYLQRGKKDGGREPARLIAASLDGKTSKVIVENATNAAYVDGQLLYGRDRSLMIQPFDPKRLELTGEARMLVREKLSYWEPKNLLAFSVSNNGALVYLPRVDANLSLRVLDRSGRDIVRISEKGESGGGAFAPDGKRIAYTFGDTETEQDIWLYDLERNRANRLTFEPGSYRGISWSPDAAWLYFTSQPKGVADIFRKPLASGDIDRFVGGSTWKLSSPGALSPDGGLFCFAIQSAETGFDLWMKRTDEPEGEPELLLQTPADELDASFYPEGRWISYTSTATGRPEVYVRSLDGSEQWQVSSEGGVAGRWRNDGKELIYVSPAGNVMAVPIENGERFEPGEPVELFEIQSRDRNLTGASSLADVSPDGQRLLVITAAEDQAPPQFHVVLNWAKDRSMR